MENSIKNGISRVAENREHREGGLARPIEEQTASLNEINEVTNALSEDALSLQEEIRQFKL